MIDYVAVTLTSSFLKRARDLFLPLDVPEYVLVESLLRGLDIQLPPKSRGVLSVLEERRRRELLPQRTLRESGLFFGQTLVLESKRITATAFLQCLHGPDFDLEKTQMFIGCRSDMDIDLRGIPRQEFVSGRHAKIVSRAGEYFFTDLASTNGTTINGRRIPPNSEQRVKNDDTILLGISPEKGILLKLIMRE